MTADENIRIASPRAFRLAAGLGFLAVALGAFGAHGMRDLLARRSMTAVWEKAVFYHFVHALVMLLLACLSPFPSAAWRLFGVGVLAFSGSLYLLALTGMYWLVFVTPVGGMFLLAGWLWLAVGGGRKVLPDLEKESP